MDIFGASSSMSRPTSVSISPSAGLDLQLFPLGRLEDAALNKNAIPLSNTPQIDLNTFSKFFRYFQSPDIHHGFLGCV
jgi:hypothetical protein